MTILAEGQIAITQSTIFEVKDTSVLQITKADVNKVTFFNTSPITQTAILYVKKFDGIARKLRQFILRENEGGEYLEPGDKLELDHGDVLQAETTTADVVNFVVFGIRL